MFPELAALLDAIAGALAAIGRDSRLELSMTTKAELDRVEQARRNLSHLVPQPQHRPDHSPPSGDF